jgi:head-tail adaptor
MSFDSLMNQQARLYRRTVADDAIGGQVETWRPTRLFMPCRIQALSLTERAMMGSRGVDVTHRIFLRPDPIRKPNEKDKLLIGGVTYQLEGINDVDKMGHHIQADAREMRDGGGVGG